MDYELAEEDKIKEIWQNIIKLLKFLFTMDLPKQDELGKQKILKLFRLSPKWPWFLPTPVQVLQSENDKHNKFMED